MSRIVRSHCGSSLAGRLTWVWLRPPRTVLEPSFEDSAPPPYFPELAAGGAVFEHWRIFRSASPMIWNALDILDCMRCRSEEAERFCQPCLRWVCTERCWPGDHFNNCWDCLPQRSQLKPNAEATIPWRIFARKMNRFAGVCLIYAYRRINPRRVAPRFDHWWYAPWDDYNWDAVWGPDVVDMPGIGNEPARSDLA